MARPRTTPPQISYVDWLAAGCPPIKLSAIQLATWVTPHLSTVRIYALIKRGDLVQKDKVIDSKHPRNLEWLRSRIQAPEPVRGPGRRGLDGSGDQGHPTPEHKLKPDAPPRRQETEGTLDIEVILEAVRNNNLGAMTQADVQKIARLESALKTRVEREAKRGLLIDRKLVQTVFGRLYQIDSNQFKTLGAKLAPDIGGELGVEDAATLLRIEQRIDEETSRILSHIKKLLDDFLTSVGAEAC